MRRSLFASPGDSALCRIVDRNLDRYLISEQDLDIVHAELSGDMGGYDHIVRKLYLEGCVGENLNYRTFKLDDIVFRQNNLLLSTSVWMRDQTFVRRIGPSAVRATVCS